MDYNTLKREQLLDAILKDPNRMFQGAPFAPFEWNAYFKSGGRWVSKIHLDDGTTANGRKTFGAYIDDGRHTGHPVMLMDESGGRGYIEITKWWKQEHGENSMSELYQLYDIEPPHSDPEQAERERKRRTETDLILSQIRKDFLGDTGAAVRDYLTRPIEQGGRGWKADTVAAMADKNYIGVVTNKTARLLSELSGLNIPANIADTHPFVIFTFAKSDGRLQYIKFRTIDPQAKGGDKWRNPTKGKTGVGRDDVDPFNYNNVSFLSATGSRTLVVVESELCAAHATVAGIKNVVALRGSDGIKQQFAQRVAFSGCNNIVLLYDTEGDATKQNNTDKKLIKTINGLREYVERIAVHVATIPTEYNAKDPDELLSRHPDGSTILQDIIDNAPTATDWMAYRYARTYKDATTTEERQRIEYDVINQSATLKEIGGVVAIEGDRLTGTFCALSGTTITADTMAQAANEKALQSARDKFNKQRNDLLAAYDTARKEGDNDKAAEILNQITHLTEPQSDPELNQEGKSFKDIAADLCVDETANIETSYNVNCKDRTGHYTPHPVILPANGITYIAGGTGHGKSTMLQNIAYNLLKQGKRVLYYGFEEVKRDTLFEFINIMVHDKRPELLELSRDGSTQGINKYLKTGDFKVFKYRTFDERNGYDNTTNDETDPDRWKQRDSEISMLQKNIAEIICGFLKEYRGMDGGQQTLFVYDDTFTSSELVEHIARVAPVVRPDAIFIDYIQFLQSDPNNTRSAQWEDLGKVSKDLIRINKTHQIPVVAAAQLNERGSVISSPDQLNYTHIFGASAIAQGASAVFVLGKGSRYGDQCKVTYCGVDDTPLKTNQMWFKCVKNRFGEDGGQAIYKFDGAKRYIDPETLEEPDAPNTTDNNGIAVV